MPEDTTSELAGLFFTLKDPVYTWRTLTGVKLNNNRTQYSRPGIFWQRNQGTEPKLH